MFSAAVLCCRHVLTAAPSGASSRALFIDLAGLVHVVEHLVNSIEHVVYFVVSHVHHDGQAGARGVSLRAPACGKLDADDAEAAHLVCGSMMISVGN